MRLVVPKLMVFGAEICDPVISLFFACLIRRFSLILLQIKRLIEIWS